MYTQLWTENNCFKTMFLLSVITNEIFLIFSAFDCCDNGDNL